MNLHFRKKPADPPATRQNAPAMCFEVDGIALPVVIREHGRARRLTLRMDPGGKALRVTAPVGLASSDIRSFLVRHRAWIAVRLSRYRDHCFAIRDGGSVPIRGVEHRIVASGRLRGLSEPGLEDDGPVLTVGGAPDRLGRRVADYLKKQAEGDLKQLVECHAECVGKPYRSIRLKDTRSRWGSCSAQGNLSFSWRIVMAPPHVIDYLAAHETAHLKEMNHGPRFWSLCHSLCPQTDEARAWLKSHGSRLQAYDFTMNGAGQA